MARRTILVSRRAGQRHSFAFEDLGNRECEALDREASVGARQRVADAERAHIAVGGEDSHGLLLGPHDPDAVGASVEVLGDLTEKLRVRVASRFDFNCQVRGDWIQLVQVNPSKALS